MRRLLALGLLFTALGFAQTAGVWVIGGGEGTGGGGGSSEPNWEYEFTADDTFVIALADRGDACATTSQVIQIWNDTGELITGEVVRDADDFDVHVTFISPQTGIVVGNCSGGGSGGGSDDQTAAEVANTPAGNIAASDVQAALNELDGEKASDSGTSGGIPYFNSSTSQASSAALTVNLPVIGGGAGAAPSVGTRSGNTTAFVTTTGTQTSGRCVEIDANGNHVAAADVCGSGGGGTDDQTAAEVPNTPAGAIAATNVQTALNELDTEKQPLDATLTAVAALDSTAGVVAQTGADAFARRTLTGTADEIAITNGSGASGNPTFALAALVDLGGKALAIPNGTTLPATCTVGQQFMDTDATAGQRHYLCESTDTWAVQGDGGGPGAGDDQDATEVPVTPSTTLGIAADDVQEALEELGAEKPHIYVGNTATINAITPPTGVQAFAIINDAVSADDCPGSGPPGGGEPIVPALCFWDGAWSPMLTPIFGAPGTPWNLEGITDDAAPSVPSSTDAFSAYFDRADGILKWKLEDGASSRVAVTTTDTQTLTNKTLTSPVIATISNTGTVTLPTSTDTLVGKATTDTLTNKTYDVEGTGNSFSTVDELWVPAGINDGGTPGASFDIPATGGPAKTAIDGTDSPVTKTMSLDFDASSDECVQTGLFFPTGTTSITAMIKHRAAATSGEVQFNAQTKCTGDGETLSQTSWNAIQSFAPDTAKGTTLQTNNTNALTLTLTGCAATELMRVRICRNADASDDDAGVTEVDDMTGDAQVLGMLLTIRRTL